MIRSRVGRSCRAYDGAEFKDFAPRFPVQKCSHHIILAPTNRQGEEAQIALRGFTCSGVIGSTKTSPEGVRLLPASIGPHKYFTTRHFVFTMEPACSGASLKTSSTIEFCGLYSLNNIGSPAGNLVRRRPGRRAIQFAPAERLPRDFALQKRGDFLPNQSMRISPVRCPCVSVAWPWLSVNWIASLELFRTCQTADPHVMRFRRQTSTHRPFGNALLLGQPEEEAYLS